MTHRILVYGAYGWLAFGGAMHFAIDVVSQHLRGKHAPGPETTLYYGLHSAYALGQVVLAAFVLIVARQSLELVSQWPIVTLSLLAAAGWLTVGFFCIEYWEPKFIVAVFAALVVAATLTA